MKKTFTKLMLLSLLSGIAVNLNSQNVVAHWTFNETTGSVGSSVKDELGISNGVFTGTSITNPFQTGAFTATGNCLDLSQSSNDAAIEVSGVENLKFGASQNFSITVLVKMPIAAGTTGDQVFFNKGSRNADLVAPENAGQWYALNIKNNDIVFAVDDNVTKSQVNVTKGTDYATWNENTWYLIAGVRRAQGFLTIYVNGDSVESIADNTTGAFSAGNEPAQIGNMLTKAGKFLFKMDELKIHDKALTSVELAALYTYYQTTTIPQLEKAELCVYPNPASEKIMFRNANDKAYANIYDVTGKLVKSAFLCKDEKEINISSLNKGLYYISIVNSKNKTITKGSFIKK